MGFIKLIILKFVQLKKKIKNIKSKLIVFLEMIEAINRWMFGKKFVKCSHLFRKSDTCSLLLVDFFLTKSNLLIKFHKLA